MCTAIKSIKMSVIFMVKFLVESNKLLAIHEQALNTDHILQDLHISFLMSSNKYR